MLGAFLLICVGDKIGFLCARVLWQVFRIRKQFVNYARVEGNERMVFAFGIWESPVGHSCTGRSCSLSWQVGFKAFVSGCAADPFHHLAAPNQEMKIAKSPNLERNSARYSEWILSYCGLKLCMSSHTPGFVGLCLEAVGPRLGDSKFYWTSCKVLSPIPPTGRILQRSRSERCTKGWQRVEAVPIR